MPEHLLKLCEQRQFRCAARVKCTLDFENLVQRTVTHLIKSFKIGRVTIGQQEPRVNWGWEGLEKEELRALPPRVANPTGRDNLPPAPGRHFSYSAPAERKRAFPSPGTHSANERRLQLSQ